jgi:hypothetical protein
MQLMDRHSDEGFSTPLPARERLEVFLRRWAAQELTIRAVDNLFSK